MKSTGEVMGVGGSFAEAFKSQLAAGDRFPKQGQGVPVGAPVGQERHC